MKDFSNKNKFQYLNKSRKCLDIKQNRAGHNSIILNKMTAAAIITLASGSMILFSSNNSVKADQTNTVQSQLQEQKQTQTQESGQTQVPKDDESDQAQTQDEAGHQDANGKELPANQQDHVKGNVQGAWDQGYQGQHQVVAVIDSGVDVDHKDFQTMPKDPKFSADDMKKKISDLGYGKYVNEKFPYVYNAVDNENDHMKGPDDEPHGQHVSGIIAADGHADGDKEYVVGVAPEAQLMHFKVFGDTTTALDIAKSIIDATNLGADVIQMSLGGGVAANDPNIVDQRAVQYAIDHGVVVSISASNNGNAASVTDPSHLTKTDDYEAGGAAGNYEPFSSSTVANPGAAQNAITVAAEQSGLGKNSDMASFSSWGPLPDFTLKPDVSAPGYQVISTGNDNKYVTMSGTSMAGPFVAGAAALVKQRLQKTNPELKGAELVAAVKALLMNTAHPQTQQGYDTPVSPRRQGAGQIDVGAATQAPVYVTAADGTSSVSLRKVNESTNFELTFHNLSDQAQTYNFDDFGGGYTEKRESDTGVFHDEQLAGAQVTGENSFTLAPKETKKLSFNLKLTGLKQNQLVEGYLNFTNQKDKSTIVVPYLAYYGDMTSENVFDQNANDQNGADIQGNRFVNENNYPRGIADQESLKELINVDGTYNWQQVAKLYESGKVAFSPNNDNKSDLIKPYAYFKQNLQDLKVEILDSTGKVVRVLADSHGIEKSYSSDGDSATVDFGYAASNSDAFEWDGKLYDKKTGKMVAAPDGNYTYRFVATLVNDGPHKVQTNDTPVVIDTTAPVLSNLNYDPATFTLKGNYEDTGSGFTDYSYATVTVNDQVFGFKLNDGQSGFDNAEKTKGHFVFTLNDDEKKALSDAVNKVSLALSDVADNTVVKTLDVAPVSNNKKLAVWNATNGLGFDQKSPDFDAGSKTYLLRGNSKNDFYVNGKLVQVDEQGNFVLPVANDESELTFTSDQAGKDILEHFALSTPKAKFAWQHVDGEKKSFGAQVYSVYGSNPDDIVVQAAVSKGDNVKAFAKDYFTGTVYEGVVKDGVATFHVKTSINKDDATGIYKRALLQGWTEVDGPSFNDKQKTDPTDIKDENYIGVYYDQDAKKHEVYTNRDDLGVENFKDETADPKDFGPGYYPGYSAPTAGSADLTFDYLSDNNSTVVNHDAVDKGWYDPETHLFTLTGKANKNVTSLTFLAHGLNEDDPDNQADLSNDGKFKVSFKIDNPATRQLSYLYKTKNGKTTRGSLTLILDTVAPTLTVNGLTTEKGSEFTTNKPSFKLSGTANDNLDGYSVFINGDNVFTQYANSGYDYLPDLYKDNPEQKTPNSYGYYQFNQEENLDDNNGKPTTHVFTVGVVDQAGNKTEKQFVVHYDPNWTPNTDSGSTTFEGGSSDSVPAVPSKPANPVVPVDNGGSNGGNAAENNLKVELVHNAYGYNHLGNVVLQNDKRVLFKKGEKLVVWSNGKVFDIQGKKFYQVASDLFVKVANTVNGRGLDEKLDFKVKLVRNSFVYDSKGKLVKRHKKHVLLKKNRVLETWHKGKVFKIKGKKYYQVGKNGFVKVVNTKKLTAAQFDKIKLKRRSFVYDNKGKRVGHTVLKKNKVLTAQKNRKVVTIKGKKFYQIGKNKFVKKANVVEL